MPSNTPPPTLSVIKPTLQPTCLGALRLDAAQHPQGRLHLSAASGLVRSGKSLFVVADDELHLGVFDDTLTSGTEPPPGRLLCLLEGDLPQDPVQRKKAKPDLETLALLPALPGCVGGALLALGSGSKSNRETGVLLALAGPGKPTGRMAKVDLKPLYAPLRKRFADLNIEGAWVSSGELLLLHRGNKGDVRSACIRYDGACVGSVIGIVDVDGQVRMMWGLQGAPKVEGIAVQREDDDWLVTMVTDPDDATVASQWLSVRFPLLQRT